MSSIQCDSSSNTFTESRLLILKNIFIWDKNKRHDIKYTVYTKAFIEE